MAYFVVVNGIAIKVKGQPRAAQKGGFEGRVGSVSRSRKGRTVRNPDGKRGYVWATEQPEAAWYSAKRR